MDADLFLGDDEPHASPQLRARRVWRERLARWHPRQWQGTLQARLAAGGLLALLLGMTLSVGWTTHRAEQDVLAQAARREQGEAMRSAMAIGRRIDVMRQALTALAPQIDNEAVQDPRRLGQLLERQAVLRGMFANLFVTTPRGHMQVYVDALGMRTPGTELGDRNYFQTMLRERRGVISEPLAGRVAGEPVVVFLQPLLDAQGLRGSVGGALRLTSRDLLADLAQSPEGPQDTQVIVTDPAGHIVAHPQRSRVMANVADEPALAAAHARWVAAGRPAHWADDAQAHDEPHIVATATDAGSGWHVWRLQDRSALLAPLHEARLRSMQAAAGLAVLLSGLLIVYLGWQLQPLNALERRAARLLEGDAEGDWPKADGEVGRLSRTLRHVWAERRQMEDFNAQVLRKLGSVMSAAPVGIAFTRNQRFELVSAEFCKLLGYAEHTLLGQPTVSIFASPDDYAALGEQVGAAFSEGDSYAGEWQLRHMDGRVFWGGLRARPVDTFDRQAGTIWSVNDVSDQVHSRRQLEHAAMHDALTGVMNRKGFEQALSFEFSGQPASRPAAVVMIDLDHFKPINDTAGHAAGDAMLVAVAQAISSRVRGSDTVARLGGDEFALLLPHCDHDRALMVAEKVRLAITEAGVPWNGSMLRVGASLGVAELGPQHETVAQWLEQADAACYEAKRSGRGSVRSARGNLRVVSSS
ncbi:sensor domain-containing diguanylate cyclase [Aquabacterium sp. OR-4]|uniref:sensor domain-containing diguanylate cyclase n=1 Tax=Aquabacterium sp. OR-4 TaxID=2978127 RepID=UPI0021B3C979|nr:diguanylate cyclase [Aquabacterium sp. OR-4]MDT7835118.1 diguanylate cyclase [Aquabacterium sp. OR-4]